MTNSKRQPYGFGSFVKKFTKPIKKIVKSPLGKAALLGGLGWGAHKGMLPGGFGTGWGSKLAQAFGNKEGILAQLFRTKDKATGKYGGVSLGKLGLMGLLGAGTALPFMGEEEEEVVETPWDVMPSSIANLRNQAKNYYTSATPNYLGSPFMPLKEYVQPTFYSAKGGLAQLANGGGVAEAQAEQMLKMEYQKYRNQGGTMSYQQFKMTVLKQAQGRGPMAQGQPRMAQPQMAAEGGIMDLGGMEKDYSFIKYVHKDWLKKILGRDIPLITSWEGLNNIQALRPDLAQTEEFKKIVNDYEELINYMKESDDFPDHAHPGRILHEQLAKELEPYV